MTPPAELIQRSVSAEKKRYLEACTEAASRFEMPLYLVGGAIRDLLLTGEFLELDLDLVAEGNAMDLAREVAHELHGELRTHPRFLTSEVVVAGTHIDLVTARSERYTEPASLPVVSPGDIGADLARRDFTVNAMALPLWPAGRDGLIDPWEGQRDLELRLLRVLHEQSFFDDPTRILRGVRIGARLGLDLENRTAELARTAIGAGAFEPLSASRLRHELILLLEDRQVEVSIHRLEDLGFFSVLGRTAPLSDSDFGSLSRVLRLKRDGGAERLKGLAPQWWLVELMSFSAGEDDSHRATMARRLGLDGNLSKVLIEFPGTLQRATQVLQTTDLPPREVHKILVQLSPEEVVLLLATGPDEVTSWIHRWVEELRKIHLTISGRDLKEAGLSQSPEMGRALQATLDARLDGDIEATQELEFAIDRMREVEE